jgi:hypothetical protein
MIANSTRHAQARIQQRGIPPLVIELLERFGSSMRCKDAERLFFDNSARRRLTAHLGGHRGLSVIDRWLDVYAIVADNGTVVTVAHKTKRFKHFK